MSEPITNVADAVRELGALPVPAGTCSQASDLEHLRQQRDAFRDQRNHVFKTNERLIEQVRESEQARLLAENEARQARREVAALQARVDEAERAYTFDTAELKRRIAELEAERHSTNEALDDAVKALRARGADESADAERDPIPLRWGLNDVEWCDDDNVIVLLSGPDGEPYTLELEPSQAAVLREDLAGPDGPAAFRAAWDTEQVGPLYGREEVARAHCERDARLDYPDGTVLVWRAFRDDDAELFAVEAGEERPTGYTVTRQPLASEVVEEGGE